MGTSRCRACGSALPDGAQFCPSCGSGQQPAAVPILDLGAPTRAPVEDEEPRDRTVATAVGLVLGAIALLVVLSIVAGGGDEDDQGADEQGADEPAPSATSPRSTATTLPRPTIDVPPVLAEGGTLDPAFGMAVVSFRSNGTVVVVDLGTGEERVLERIPVTPVQSAAWVDGTFVVKSIGEDLHRLVLDGSNSWERLDVDEGVNIDMQWGGPAGVFWVWDQENRPYGGPGFALVGSQGPIRFLGGQNIGMFGTAAGVIDGKAVVNSPDGIVFLGEGPEARRYDYGLALGAHDPYLARRVCDDQLVCRLVIDDTSTGEITDMGPIDSGSYVHRSVPSPDGTAVAAVVAEADGGTTVVVRRVGDGQPRTFDAGFDDLSLMRWSPDGDGLIWWSEAMGEVHSVRWRDGEATPDLGVVGVAHGQSSASYGGIFVVPLAELPPGWAPNEG